MSKVSELFDEETNFDSMHLDVSHHDLENYGLTLAELKKTNPAMHRAIAPLVAHVAALQNKTKNNNGMDSKSIIDIISNSDASYYIGISRATANILATANGGGYTIGTPVALPFVIYGQNDYGSDYNVSLQAAMATLSAACPGIGVTLGKSNPGNVTFTYLLGMKTDIVTVYYTGKLTNYLAILNSQNQKRNYFKSCYINYTISDAVNGELQLNNANLQFVDVSAAGSQAQTELIINSILLGDIFRNDRINAVFPWTLFNADKSIVDTCIPCPAADIAAGVPFIITYNMFIKWAHPEERVKR